MNLFVTSSCVRWIAIILISTFCIVATLIKGATASAILIDPKEVEIHGKEYVAESIGYYNNKTGPTYRQMEIIEISKSQCPNFCECEHILGDGGGGATAAAAANATNIGSGTAEIAVYCHQGNLEQVAFSKMLKQIPKDVTILDVQAPIDQPNHLLWDDNLNQLRHLRILRLINCAIPAISRALKLHALEVLDLQANRIQHLPVSVFAGVPSIRELNLAMNSLSVLPTGAFAYLKSLQTLSLAHNNITEVTVNLLRDLRNLKSLHLDGNRISVAQFNALFADVPQLERLELNECGLSMGTVNDLAFNKFHALRRLGLAGNMLGKVPKSTIRNYLGSLHTIDLSNNELVEIEAEVFVKTNISHLLLAGNHLGTNANSLTFHSLKTGTMLRELDLSRNNYQQFQAQFLGVAREAVEILHLSGNYISSIEKQLTANMTKLNVLHLGYNFIEYLPQQLPDEFTQLTLLNVSGNQLSTLVQHLPENFPMLRILDISSNRFASFPITMIQNFFNNLDKVSISLLKFFKI